MRRLIIVLYGDYDHDSGDLTESGREQISRTAEEIKELIEGGSCAMISSTAPEASRSADIISDELGIPFESDRVLRSESLSDVNLSRVGQLIERCEADNLILVTHYHYAEELPGEFGNSIGAIFLRQAIIGRGEAHVIDCEAMTLSRIR